MPHHPGAPNRTTRDTVRSTLECGDSAPPSGFANTPTGVGNAAGRWLAPALESRAKQLRAWASHTFVIGLGQA